MGQGNAKGRSRAGLHFSLSIEFVILSILTVCGTVSANPVSLDSLGDTFYDNLILIFLLNLPLDALVFAYVLDKHFFSGFLFNPKKKSQSSERSSHPTSSKPSSASSDGPTSPVPSNIVMRFTIITVIIAVFGSIVDYTFRTYISPPEFIFVFMDLFSGSSTELEYPLIIIFVLLLISLSVFISYLVGIRFDRKKALDASVYFMLLNIVSWTILSLYVILLGVNIGTPIPNGWIVLPVLLINIGAILSLLQAYQRYLILARVTTLVPAEQPAVESFPPLNTHRSMVKPTAVCIVWVLITTYALVAIAGDSWWDFFQEEEPRYELFYIGADIHQDDEGNYVVEIHKVDPDAITHRDIKYEILDGNGSVVVGLQGSLESIFNSSNPSGPISFEEYDHNGRLSAGDSFHILSEANGGRVKPGYALIIRERYDNKVLNAFDEPFILL